MTYKCKFIFVSENSVMNNTSVASGGDIPDMNYTRNEQVFVRTPWLCFFSGLDNLSQYLFLLM